MLEKMPEHLFSGHCSVSETEIFLVKEKLHYVSATNTSLQLKWICLAKMENMSTFIQLTCRNN